MILEQIQIEGFRSLKSVTWKPGRLNVLIGPNGGGNSNLLRALDLLRIAATGGLREAILRMGGMVPLLWDGEARLISFGLQIKIDEEERRYGLQLTRVGATGDVHEELKERPSIDPNPYGTASPDSLSTSLARNLTRDLAGFGRLHPDVKSWSIHNDMRVDQDAELRRAAVTPVRKAY